MIGGRGKPFSLGRYTKKIWIPQWHHNQRSLTKEKRGESSFFSSMGP